MALVAMLGVGVPALAHAQTPLEQAKTLADRATIEYQVGHFDEALVLYGKAYEAYPKPELLFDIGQCHRMLKDYERAIFFYQGYLRAKPDARNRPLVEQLLDESTRHLEEQRGSEAARAEAERRAAAQTPAPSPESSPTPAASASAPSTSDSGAATRYPALRIAGLATAGVGVVALGTAAYFDLHAASLSRDISQLSVQHGTWSSGYSSDYQSGKTAATAATVLYVAGGAALATGAVLTYLGWPRRPSDAQPVAAITPARGGAALAVIGRF